MTSSSSLPTAEADGTGKHRPAPSPAKAAAGKEAPAQPAKIPLSAYAPVLLARPMSVFGAKFEVHLSASCTLNPGTALQAVMDTSLLTFLRTENPAQLQNLKTLIYAGTGKHQPSETTRKRIQQDLKLLDAEAVVAVLNGREPPPAPPHSDWRAVLMGMGEGESHFVRDLTTNLASWDDQALHIRALVRAGQQDQAQARTAALMGTGPLAWEALNPRLLQAPQVLVLLESCLQTLARLMCAVDMPSLDLPARESNITELLDPGRRPLGHWLYDVQQASECTSLSALAQRLLSVGARHHDRAVSHDLLKKWSSSKNVVMPQTAAKPVLRGVRIRARADRLQDRFYVARLLTFLCDLTCSGIPGEAPAWADIQAQLKDRYSQVYRLEAANWPRAPGAA
ncbi:hypothetical protein [Polaromonas sp.]|uniref:hypothetical protein n=1 Tax=Polaromonas sp. TaxID=1869339 RepID=UPI001DE01DCC|nr:hypothetical protein [Polaromonas sp.]MBT9475235.1 hypothetical protein [Polaromonas sp.]